MTSYACSPNIKTYSLYILISPPNFTNFIPLSGYFYFYIYFSFRSIWKGTNILDISQCMNTHFLSPSLSNLKKISSNNGEINNCVIEVLFRFFFYFFMSLEFSPLSIYIIQSDAVVKKLIWFLMRAGLIYYLCWGRY